MSNKSDDNSRSELVCSLPDFPHFTHEEYQKLSDTKRRAARVQAHAALRKVLRECFDAWYADPRNTQKARRLSPAMHRVFRRGAMLTRNMTRNHRGQPYSYSRLINPLAIWTNRTDFLFPIDKVGERTSMLVLSNPQWVVPLSKKHLLNSFSLGDDAFIPYSSGVIQTALMRLQVQHSGTPITNDIPMHWVNLWRNSYEGTLDENEFRGMALKCAAARCPANVPAVFVGRNYSNEFAARESDKSRGVVWGFRSMQGSIQYEYKFDGLTPKSHDDIRYMTAKSIQDGVFLALRLLHSYFWVGVLVNDSKVGRLYSSSDEPDERVEEIVRLLRPGA